MVAKLFFIQVSPLAKGDPRTQETVLAQLETVEHVFASLWSDSLPMLLDCRCYTPCTDAADCLFYGSPYFIRPHQGYLISDASPAPTNPKQRARTQKRRQMLALLPNPKRKPRRSPIRVGKKNDISARSKKNRSAREKVQGRESGRCNTAHTSSCAIAGTVETKQNIEIAHDKEYADGTGKEPQYERITCLDLREWSTYTCFTACP